MNRTVSVLAATAALVAIPATANAYTRLAVDVRRAGDPR